MTAIGALLEGIVDYAGLFPPAALDMSTAVQNFSVYRQGPDRWMLGRFIVPAARLDEFQKARASSGTDRDTWPLSVLLDIDVRTGLEQIDAFNHAPTTGGHIDSVEIKLSTPASIVEVARMVPPEFELFVEIPVTGEVAPLIAAIRDSGVNAKIRTGGVTADAFPAAQNILAFIRACVDAEVAFKATAGLHHPLRGTYRLTYASDAPAGEMFGFLNVFLATAAICGGMDDATSTCLLTERDASSLVIADDHISWRGHSWSAEQLRDVRHTAALSFGSCSFAEPVDEIAAIEVAR